MGKITYNEWLNGCGCQGGVRPISGSDSCDCDSILLEISNLHTDDGILQDEIDELSGKVETDYYTKEEVDEKIASGGSGITIDAYTKQESDARYQPIGNYALKSEIPSLSGYATEQWVENKNYLTEHQPLKTINGQVISGTGNIVIEASGSSVTVDEHLDLNSTNPAQNKAITEALNGKLDTSAYTPTDLSNYYDKTEVDNIVTSAITDVEAEIPSLSGYATQAWVEDKNYANASDAITNIVPQYYAGMGNYGITYTKNGSTNNVLVFGLGYGLKVGGITSTVEVDTSKIARKSDIPTSNSAFTNDAGYITSANTYTKAEVDAIISGLTSQIETLTARINNCCGSYPVSPTDLRYTGTTTGGTEISLSCCTEPLCEELVSHSIVETTQATGNLKTINVGECITIIGNDAFTGETNLTTVILPSTITYIRNAMLANCTSIQNLTLLATTPPTLSEGRLFGVEEQIPSGFKINVPATAVNTYKQASGWSTYSNIIETI